MRISRAVDVTGTIDVNELGYTLIPEGGVPGGGSWILGRSRKVAPYLGRLVRIRGVRFDFASIDVSHIEAIDGRPEPVHPSLWLRTRAHLKRWTAVPGRGSDRLR